MYQQGNPIPQKSVRRACWFSSKALKNVNLFLKSKYQTHDHISELQSASMTTSKRVQNLIQCRKLGVAGFSGFLFSGFYFQKCVVMWTVY